MRLAFNHLPFKKLADLAEGRLPSNERPQVVEHISACHRCATELTRLEKLIALMRTDKAEEAPQEIIARAVSLFRSRRARAVTPELSLPQRLLAVLSFDSLQTSAAYGIRSSQAAARQLLYVVGDYDIDLRVAPAGAAWVISGQVFGPNCTGGRIEVEGNERAEQLDLSEQCEFALPPLPTGNYQLRLRLSSAEIEMPELKVGA
jgi:hypothetical protein